MRDYKVFKNAISASLQGRAASTARHGAASEVCAVAGDIAACQYVHGGTLWAATFDLDQLAVSGPPVPVIEGVTSNAANGSAQVAMSASGMLAYLPGQGTSGVPIHWVDREGKTTPLRSAPANWTALQFAPDGRRLALQINVVGSGADIWVYEWERDLLTRLTSDPGDHANPVWTPDSRRIVFGSTPGNQGRLQSLLATCGRRGGRAASHREP